MAAKVATKSNQPLAAFLASGPHFHNLFRAFKTASDSHSPDVVTDGETVCPSEAVETYMSIQNVNQELISVMVATLAP